MPTINFDYTIGPDNDKAAAVVVDSLGEAGITVKLKPLEAGAYYGVVFDPEKAGELVTSGWAPDWPKRLDRHCRRIFRSGPLTSTCRRPTTLTSDAASEAAE